MRTAFSRHYIFHTGQKSDSHDIAVGSAPEISDILRLSGVAERDGEVDSVDDELLEVSGGRQGGGRCWSHECALHSMG